MRKFPVRLFKTEHNLRDPTIRFSKWLLVSDSGGYSSGKLVYAMCAGGFGITESCTSSFLHGADLQYYRIVLLLLVIICHTICNNT